MSVADCQSRVSSFEFALWKEYFKEEWNRHEKTDYYLASIVREIRQFALALLSSGGKGVSIDDCLIRFSTGGHPKIPLKERIKMEKLWWAAHLGMDLGLLEDD